MRTREIDVRLVAWRSSTALVLAIALCQGCQRAPAPQGAALEECDPAGYVRCIQQSVFLSIPVPGTGLSLTYSSRWNSADAGRDAADAGRLGLGGWSVNALQHYDSAGQTLSGGDGSWRLTAGVALPSGERAVPSFDGSLAYIFDHAGRHVRTVDGRLGTQLVTIAYDAGGRLASIDGSIAGQPVHLAVRRAEGTPRALAGSDGGTTMLDVDGSGHLVRVTDLAGSATQIAWDAHGLVASETGPLGAVARFGYDDSGRLIAFTDADGVTLRLEHETNSDGIEIQASTALGRRWTYRSGIRDGVARRAFIAPDGSTTTETVDAQGTRAISFADGTKWTVGAVAHPTWGRSVPLPTPMVSTRSDGVTSRGELQYAVQPRHGLPYVLAGSVTTVVNGQSWIERLDPGQRTRAVTDPIGRTTTTTYDTAGRVVSESGPGVAAVSYSYDRLGRLVGVVRGPGTPADTTHYAYDASSGRITISRPDKTNEQRLFDRAGRIVSVSGDASGVMASYDAAGHLTGVQPPVGLMFTLGASAAGRPTGFAPPVVPGDSSVETTTYDADGQLVSRSGLGHRGLRVTYDGSGKLATWTFDRGTSTASYDPRSGLVSRTVDPAGIVTTYGYAGSTPTQLAWSGPINASVSVTLDANGRMARESVNGADTLGFSYDPAGNLTGIGPLSLKRTASTGLVEHTTLGVVETNNQFDVRGRLVRSTTTAAGKVVLDQRYARDAAGRIHTISDAEGDATPSTSEYAYDPAGRLAAVRVNGHPVGTNRYDPAGNRIGSLRPGGDVSARYDDRDRLMAWGDAQYAWRPDGQLQRLTDRAGVTAFSYDDFGALRAVTLPGGRVVTYLVDAEGRRVGETVGGALVAEYLYRPDGLVVGAVDVTSHSNSHLGYDEMGHLALVSRGGAMYRVITDMVGSPRLVMEARTGRVVDVITYDAWGSITRETVSGFLPIGFAGGLRDASTGFVRFGARDYDPMSGRWTGPDPLRFAAGDANLYRYAADDPVNRVDPTGLQCVETGRSTTCYQPPPNNGGGWLPHPVSDGWCTDNGICWFGPPPGYGPPPNPDPPPGDGGAPYSCRGLVCDGPNGIGCRVGSCSNGPGGFRCTGLVCDGPNGTGCRVCSMGDTHVLTAAGVHFDFQAAGEFLVASSRDGHLVLQARQEPVLGGTEITFNTAVAANVNGDHVSVYAREPATVVVNDAPQTDPDVERRLPHGGTLRRHGGLVVVTWPDASRLIVTQTANTLNYSFTPAAGTAPELAGLLGNADGHGTGHLTGRDGSALERADPDFQAKVYQQIANSWRVKQSEALFHYWPGESSARFTDLAIPSRPATIGSLSAAVRANADTVCRGLGVRNQPLLDDCVLDVGVTGIPAFATASAWMAAGGMFRGAGVAPASGSGAAGQTPAPQAAASSNYRIANGDTVSPGRPGPGAGVITRGGEKQSYAFNVKRGEIWYVGVGPCTGASVSFDVHNQDGTSVAGQIGCGSDIGPITVSDSGTYRIVATADSAARYTFSLRTTAFDRYTIVIGDTVSPNRPTAGAGVIGQPGERQSYSFTAPAGAIVYVKVGPCESAGMSFDLLGPDNGIIDGKRGCGDFGPTTLATAGVYRLVASADRGAARYTFALLPTTLDHFTIKIGDTVSPGHPSAGAGIIGALGERQSYGFSARAGAIVYVKVGPCEGALIRLDLLGPDNKIIGGKGGCGDFGPTTLPAAGVYRIVTSADRGAARYTFSLSSAPPRH